MYTSFSFWYLSTKWLTKFHAVLVHGQVTIIFVVFVCLFVQFFSTVFDPISIKLGHMLHVRV